MALWDELTGQADAIAIVEAAAAASVDGSTESGMTHSWLITGPPGSGRSVAARAFAAALLFHYYFLFLLLFLGSRTGIFHEYASAF